MARLRVLPFMLIGHARDLLRQVKHYCEFKQLPLEMTPERFATAVRNYFAVMG